MPNLKKISHYFPDVYLKKHFTNKEFAVLLRLSLALLLFVAPHTAQAHPRYGESLCERDDYYCIRIRTSTREKRRVFILENLRTQETKEFEKLPTWQTLWPDANEREIVQRVNRLNIPIISGFVIAVPNTMQDKTPMDFSPFPIVTDPPRKKLLLWNPELLAWAAYNAEGNLVAWGPGVGGMSFCPDLKRSCRTIAGTFRILEKYGPNYRSGKYPIGECKGSEPGRPGCAPMPYFMKFHHGGLGFHGSLDVPGRHASHGCIRLFPADAEWLSKNFVEIGTEVTILPYPEH